MPNDLAIKRFVRTTLGCTCAEAVFEHIEKRRKLRPTLAHPYTMCLVIGNRLLIYVLEYDQIKAGNLLLKDIFLAGQGERNAQGYNRFRAVLIDNAADVRTEAALQTQWQQLAAGDERVHLHLIVPDELTQMVVQSHSDKEKP